MNVSNKYRSPRCGQCNHVMRFVKKKNEWSCTWCDYSCDSETAKGLYPPEVPDTLDINDVRIFGKQESAPAVASAPTTPVIVETPAPVVVTPEPTKPVVAPAPVAHVEIPTPEPEPVANDPLLSTTFIEKPPMVFCDDMVKKPSKQQSDIQSNERVALFKQIKSLPDFQPTVPELSAFSGVAQRFSIRSEK